MKNFFKFCVIFIITVLSRNLVAQGETALPFLYFNPSPKLNGLGMVGTSLPNEDPAGFYYNPAQLGYISQNNTISLQMYPSDASLKRYMFLDEIKYGNTSFNIGYNFNKLLNGINLSAGFGYIHSKFDYGNFSYTWPDSPTPLSVIDEFDEFSAYGLGVGIDYFVQFDIGFTYKQITSQLPAFRQNSVTPFDANISALDLGILLTVPISKLVDSKLQFSVPGDITALPFLNLSIGYAKLNVAKEISYIDASQADPLPRSARLGYTISTGLNIKINNNTLKAIGYDFTVDVDDILVETSPHADTSKATSTYTYSYQNFLGDIKIGRNLLGLKSDNNVVVHKGHNISLFETVSFQIGRFDGRGYSNDNSSGFGIHTKGLFTLLKNSSNNSIYNFIADHLDIQYYSSILFEDSPYEADFKGINIIWSGMTF